MKTNNEQTWEYLKENYPEIYELGQKRLAEQGVNNSDAIGLDQFIWSNTDEGHDFWREICMEGNLDVFHELYPKQPKQLTLSLHPQITTDA